jgi:hypothetical protein
LLADDAPAVLGALLDDAVAGPEQRGAGFGVELDRAVEDHADVERGRRVHALAAARRPTVRFEELLLARQRRVGRGQPDVPPPQATGGRFDREPTLGVEAVVDGRGRPGERPHVGRGYPGRALERVWWRAVGDDDGIARGVVAGDDPAGHAHGLSRP